jgi:hypothetical protein
VQITASTSPYFDLALSITNNAGQILTEVQFPDRIQFDETQVSEALFPDKPGLLIRPAFFITELRTAGDYQMLYPPCMADFIGLSISSAPFALYAAGQDEPMRIASIGFEHRDGSVGMIIHDFHTWRPDGTSWSSPAMRLRLVDSFADAVAAYRTDKGIDTYPSLQEKLGTKFDTTVSGPMLGFDCDWFGDYTGYKYLFDELPSPSLLLLSNFWTGGFHGHFPDILPPNPEFGTQEEFIAAVDYAHSIGHQLLPLLILPWWQTAISRTRSPGAATPFRRRVLWWRATTAIWSPAY